jgi:hypothetical protein
VSLKSTRHRNTGTGPGEVKEEPMAMARAAGDDESAEKKWRNFFSTILFVSWQEAIKERVTKKRPTEISSTLSSFFLSFSFFYRSI